jgi:SRSO17 transposase
VLADSAYGRSQTFRDTLRLHGLDYAVGIPSSQTLWVLDDDGQPSYAPVSASELVSTMNRRHFRRVTWRRGTRGNLAADFAFRRVKTAGDDGTPFEQRESLWLIIEWRDGEARPSHFALTTLPKGMSKVDIVRLYKERYRTELVYEEMKGELGLDHFEGRSFTGWHHHVSVAICCYAFVVAERVRRFPPSGQVARANGASSNAA